MEVRVERPEQPVLQKGATSVGPDRVELVAVVETDPVVEPQMGDHLLLPLVLVAFRRVRKPVRGRDGERQALAAGHVHRHGEDSRGVAAPGEADEARRPAQRQKAAAAAFSDA